MERVRRCQRNDTLLPARRSVASSRNYWSSPRRWSNCGKGSWRCHSQHLIKTIAAARLMGADCILSGIRPQIAQTIVHLGLELDVVSKASMADALALALRRSGKTVRAG